MIQNQTILKLADNSGAKYIKCIKILGGFKKKSANIGDFIIISVKSLRNKNKSKSKVKKGNLSKAIIIRSKKKISYKSGFFFKYFENSACIVGKNNLPIATRIRGPVPKILKKHNKIVSISKELI